MKFTDDASFGEKCKSTVENMFYDVDHYLVRSAQLPALKENFLDKLHYLNFRSDVKSILEKEFNYRAWFNSKDLLSMSTKFEADFRETIAAIRIAVTKLHNTDSKPRIVTAGDVQIARLVYSNAVHSNHYGMMMMLSILLVHWQGISIVSVDCNTYDTLKIRQDVFEFWDTFMKDNPQWKYEGIIDGEGLFKLCKFHRSVW